MIRVYAWPPVGVVGAEWTEVAPVQVSRSLITGADYISAAQRKRRHASLVVSALSKPGRMGAGYMEMLKRLLEGGIHAVRLHSYPINWVRDARREESSRASQPLLWTSEGDPLEWTSGGDELLWYTGTVLTGSTLSDPDSIVVTGLPPNKLVARPGEFLTAGEDPEQITVQILAPAYSDAEGMAVIRLFSPLPALTDVRVSIGTSDTGVFRPLELPRSMQPVNDNWFYQWQFREVFADEAGGFQEVDPWH